MMSQISVLGIEAANIHSIIYWSFLSNGGSLGPSAMSYPNRGTVLHIGKILLSIIKVNCVPSKQHRVLVKIVSSSIKNKVSVILQLLLSIICISALLRDLHPRPGCAFEFLQG